MLVSIKNIYFVYGLVFRIIMLLIFSKLIGIYYICNSTENIDKILKLYYVKFKITRSKINILIRESKFQTQTL